MTTLIFEEKNRQNTIVLYCLAVDNFDLTRKIEIFKKIQFSIFEEKIVILYLDFGTKKGEMRVTNLEQLSMSTIIVMTGL